MEGQTWVHKTRAKQNEHSSIGAGAEVGGREGLDDAADVGTGRASGGDDEAGEACELWREVEKT